MDYPNGEKSSKKGSNIWLYAISICLILSVGILIFIYSNKQSRELSMVFSKASGIVSSLKYYQATTSSIFTSVNGINTQEMRVEFSSPDMYHITLYSDEGVPQNREIIVVENKCFLFGSYGDPVDMTIIKSALKVTKDIDKDSVYQYLQTMKQVTKQPEEWINDMECYHLVGVQDSKAYIASVISNMQCEREKEGLQPFDRYTIEQITKQLTESLGKTQLKIDFWISKDQYLVKKIRERIETPNATNGILSFEMMVEYFSINETVTISPPIDNNGKIHQGWILFDDFESVLN